MPLTPHCNGWLPVLNHYSRQLCTLCSSRGNGTFVTSTPDNPPPIRTSHSTMPRPLFRWSLVIFPFMIHPTTTIRAEPLTLSTKKERERRGDLFRRPPRLPPRTCPRPRSRIFPGREGELLKAQLVSFQAGERAATGTPLSSSAYDSDKVES